MYLIVSILVVLILLFLGAYLLFRYALDNQFPGFGSKFPDRKEEYIKYVNSQLKENESFITLYRLYKNVTGRDLAAVCSKMDYDDAIEYTINFTNVRVRWFQPHLSPVKIANI